MTDEERREPIRVLLAGFKAFRATYYERRPASMRQLVSEGQKPQVLLIGCSDSRVDPALLTMAEPGELFVVRNVANLVPPYQPDGHYHGTSAAIEYAVRVLQVPHVIVLGHAQCGGIQGLMRLRSGESIDGDFVAPWVSIAGGAFDRYAAGRAPSEWSAADVERAAVRTSVENLLTFPFIKSRLDAGELQLHGWWFDLEAGAIWALSPDRQSFDPVE
jgi:carbonic anhydrase